MGDDLLWGHFLLSAESEEVPFNGSTVEGSVTRYVVERVTTVRGHSRRLGAPGWAATRVESRAPVRHHACTEHLVGVTQHAGYLGAADRSLLLAESRRQPGNLAVMIAIAKSSEWWSLGHDERRAHMGGLVPRPSGHIGLARPFSSRILRRLYHARYLPRSEWDFLTYFEFDAQDASAFAELLASLRDVQRNSEWRFVEREVEVWMRRR